MLRTAIALGIVVVGQAACGGPKAAETTAAGAPAPASSRRRSANTLSPDELPANDRSTMTVAQAIQKYRPRFLKGPGYTNENTVGSAGVILYIDDVKMPNLNELNQMRMTDIENIQYLSGAEGNMRFGMGHDNGVILVTRRH